MTRFYAQIRLFQYYSDTGDDRDMSGATPTVVAAAAAESNIAGDPVDPAAAAAIAAAADSSNSAAVAAASDDAEEEAEEAEETKETEDDLPGDAVLSRELSTGTPPDEAHLKCSGLYGNFDIIFDHFSRTFQLHTTPYAPRAMLYFVPVLIGG